MERIERLVTELRPILLEVGLKHSTIAYKKKRILDATDSQRDDAVKWLERFKIVNVVKYREAMNLVPELTRNLYMLAGKGGLETHEEKELKEAKSWLKDEWRKRPIILRRDKDVSPPKKSGKPRIRSRKVKEKSTDPK
jgi:hypothetical protein